MGKQNDLTENMPFLQPFTYKGDKPEYYLHGNRLQYVQSQDWKQKNNSQELFLFRHRARRGLNLVWAGIISASEVHLEQRLAQKTVEDKSI